MTRITRYLLAGIILSVALTLPGCAPARELLDGAGKTIDRLIHPRQW